jgi:hypothetical protein
MCEERLCTAIDRRHVIYTDPITKEKHYMHRVCAMKVIENNRRVEKALDVVGKVSK